MMDGKNNKGTLGGMQVSLRIRPVFQQEIERQCYVPIEVVRGKAQVQIKNLAFTYNYVFPQHITQQEFYDTAVKGLVGKLFQGYNVSILAYGQTGAGKTYTMGTNYSGPKEDSPKLAVAHRHLLRILILYILVYIYI
ncbi:unnamed protein product [Parnassius mnemosyne]|uniref:Kinesin motor domain-containing protein n=1 Tax=Parnassius mnemosyne TaxID=213953 RepID=A0AAV1LMF5_9NEOP